MQREERDLAERGVDPAAAMAAFAAWANRLAGDDRALVFVGFNTPFDWSFVNCYFHRFAGGNPFGFTAPDIKAPYMGATGSSWADTRSSFSRPSATATTTPFVTQNTRRSCSAWCVRSAARARARDGAGVVPPTGPHYAPHQRNPAEADRRCGQEDLAVVTWS
jgi:hypothetical protein